MIYDLLSRVYDSINSDIDYKAWADFIEKTVEKNADGRPELVLDLGCGTGGITAVLADKGYDMIGLDISPDMLNIARERNYGKNTLLLKLTPAHICGKRVTES